MKESDGIDRRAFLKGAGGVLMATSMEARSYARILGANDRIRLAQLGCGDRSEGHVHMAQLAAKQTPVEVVAVCDLWSLAQERRAIQVKKAFNLEPQKYKYSEDMLARKDIDGVMIATGDFQHAKLCSAVVQAGKDCYVEKPFANVLAEAKEARDTVKASKQIVQMGTQHRSQAYPLAVRNIIRSGQIGSIVQIEQEWNVNEERWRFVPTDTGISSEMLKDEKLEWKSWLYGRKSKLREEDTDWKHWLLGKPERPFDPHVYLEFRLYKEFSSGIFDQWLSHGCDLVHLWSDESHPASVVANGGVFVWKDGRENADTCVAAITYPKGFLYTYKTTFGNSYRSFSRIQGRDGTIENYGGEGASLFVTTKEGGRKEFDPWESGPVYKQTPLHGPSTDGEDVVQVPGAMPPTSLGPDDDDVRHLVDWLEAMQTRKQPSATVDHGFSHSIVCIMAAESYWSGKRVYWDNAREEIVDQPVNTPATS
ncbi:putative dehydrogenase [Silvibacterium bohemicum]|uniref:Putative dehydrogenase n=1 Tax=Silvibacterium bohemicum TaxID=1577686 RepID=A0A841JZ58_9BACT|nr:Gfo/Idh/MocA family oxidoreductase [Silvibacterium bohemicum]MBB6144241.1 putative dehydrogenase [Silvibacterium bohemicum]